MSILSALDPRVLTALKRVYRIKMSLYIYSVRNFLPYLVWDVTNTPHADITSSLYPIGLWGQTNKHPLQDKTNSHIKVED